MTELKTLNEIADDWNNFCRKGDDEREVDIKSLRQEAIKWIKEMGFDMATSSDKYANYLQGKIDMLAEFCNITKKDIELSAKTKEK